MELDAVSTRIDSGRERVWRQALAESQRLADDFEALQRQPSIDAQPLV